METRSRRGEGVKARAAERRDAGGSSAAAGRGAAGRQAADAGGAGGAAGGEGPQVAPAQLQALRRQAQVRVRRGAEGGHASGARPQNHQVNIQIRLPLGCFRLYFVLMAGF